MYSMVIIQLLIMIVLASPIILTGLSEPPFRAAILGFDVFIFIIGILAICASGISFICCADGVQQLTASQVRSPQIHIPLISLFCFSVGIFVGALGVTFIYISIITTFISIIVIYLIARFFPKFEKIHRNEDDVGCNCDDRSSRGKCWEVILIVIFVVIFVVIILVVCINAFVKLTGNTVTESIIASIVLSFWLLTGIYTIRTIF